MTDETKLIDEVLYGLKVPPKQTRQNKKSMERSEKNINKNLYGDVLKPLTNKGYKEGGALKAGMLGALAASKVLNKSKVKVEKPKGTKGKGSADTLTGKLVRTYSVKEKKERKEQAGKQVQAGALGSMKGIGPVTDKELKLLKTKKATGGKIDLPKAADLDGDGNFNEYETKRGEAIQKAMAEQKAEGGLVRGGGQAIKGTKFKGVF